MADMDPKPIGMMNPASRLYNDNIPATSSLKKAAEERMQKRYAGRPLMSQYTPKEGEQEQFYNDKIARMVEQEMMLNKLAASKGAANLTDAMMFAGNVMGAAEGIGALGGLLKKVPKMVNPATAEGAASSIYNKTTGRQQYFDEFGNESSIIPRKSVQQPDYTDLGNAYLQKNDPFAAPTRKSTLKDIRVSGGSTTKIPKK